MCPIYSEAEKQATFGLLSEFQDARVNARGGEFSMVGDRCGGPPAEKTGLHVRVMASGLGRASSHQAMGLAKLLPEGIGASIGIWLQLIRYCVMKTTRLVNWVITELFDQSSSSSIAWTNILLLLHTYTYFSLL